MAAARRARPRCRGLVAVVVGNQDLHGHGWTADCRGPRRRGTLARRRRYSDTSRRRPPMISEKTGDNRMHAWLCDHPVGVEP
jgi:hypothetical protein